jgi:hypothetical protein
MEPMEPMEMHVLLEYQELSFVKNVQTIDQEFDILV